MLSIDTSVLLSLVAVNFRFIQVAFQSHALSAFLEVTHNAPELFPVMWRIKVRRLQSVGLRETLSADHPAVPSTNKI